MNPDPAHQQILLRNRFGWLILATLVGALAGFLVAPQVSHSNPASRVLLAQSVFWFAATGAAGSLCFAIALTRLRISLHRISELMIVCALLACFWKGYIHAQAWDKWSAVKNNYLPLVIEYASLQAQDQSLSIDVRKEWLLVAQRCLSENSADPNYIPHTGRVFPLTPEMEAMESVVIARHIVERDVMINSFGDLSRSKEDIAKAIKAREHLLDMFPGAQKDRRSVSASKALDRRIERDSP